MSTKYSQPSPPWQNVHSGKIGLEQYKRGIKGEPGYLEMYSLKQVYPLVVKKMEFRRGQWALLIKKKWFYWAGGRLLPYEKLKEKDKYHPHLFYPYKTGPLIPRVLSEADHKRIQADAARELTNSLNRLPSIYNTLWSSYGKKSSYAVTKRIKFLGFKVTVHKYIAPFLRSAEKEIMALAKKDKTVKDFLNSLDTISGWHYRVIKGTKTRSYHSYGLALDFIPRQAEGKHMYWRWTRDKIPDWWTITHKDMWLPPESLIFIMEKYGFTWGGKWLFFDTIHFEYRPEIMIYNSLLPPQTPHE